VWELATVAGRRGRRADASGRPKDEGADGLLHVLDWTEPDAYIGPACRPETERMLGMHCVHPHDARAVTCHLCLIAVKNNPAILNAREPSPEREGKIIKFPGPSGGKDDRRA
jgi:hypothetical protein